MAELHWTMVDGVTTVWSEGPEPLRAGLLFRTGQADETLVTSGQTHLIEHLVLSGISSFPGPSNGYTSGAVTGFFTMGSSEEISTFFRIVCKNLRSLPGDRLDSEKKILAAEAATRSQDIQKSLLLVRYGVRGYGLTGMSEFGIKNAEISQLNEWSEQRFTGRNAVLWLAGPLPTDLRLELPSGEKQPLPLLEPIPRSYPSWYVNDECGGIAAGAIAPRRAASPIFCQMVLKGLYDQLRTVKALSYHPSVSYEPLNANLAHMVLYADSQPDHRVELAEEFGQFIERLTQIHVDEVEAARKYYIDTLSGPLAPPSSERNVYELQRAAMSWLFDQQIESIEELAAEAATVKISEIVDFSVEMQKSILFALPSGIKLRPCMGNIAYASNEAVVVGREVESVDAPINQDRLILGSNGVSLKYPNGSHATVRYDDLEAALVYEDGCMHLFNSKWTWIAIEPTLWRHGSSVCREIHERIPAHLFINQGARSPGAIPKPRSTMWQRFLARFRREIRANMWVQTLVGFCLFLLICIILAILLR